MLSHVDLYITVLLKFIFCKELHTHKKEISETIVSVACEHASCAVQVLFFVSGGHFPVYFNALEFFLKSDSSVKLK